MSAGVRSHAAPRFPRSSPYWPVLTHPRLRRVLPGLVVSALGDGMALLAVGWLALQLAPAGQRGTWVALALASYTLPAAAGTLVFGRLMHGRGGAQMAGWSAIVRAGALGAIPVAYALGTLSIGAYVVLLATSSLLAAWGTAGRYTLIAELLPAQQHLPANAVLTIIGEFATIVGPPLAGIVISLHGPVLVIAIDAASFAILAATYRFAMPAGDAAGTTKASTSRVAGFRLIRRDPRLLGLFTLTACFLFLFGPIYVAMPVHVKQDLHASATVLSAFYTAFGIGAVIGGLATGYLRRWPLLPTTVGTVIAFGLALLPVGLGAPIGVLLCSFVLAGLSWAPYMSTAMALLQRDTGIADLPQVLAANGSVIVLSVPLGTLFGGSLVTAIGARSTLLFCAVATTALGLAAACLLVLRRYFPPSV